MMKVIVTGALAASLLLTLTFAVGADSGHGEKAVIAAERSHPGAHEGHGPSAPVSLSGAWTAIVAARDAIASDVDSSALQEIHAKTEPFPDLVAALLSESKDLEPGKRARVEGAAKQVTRVADALHVAADRGDAARTRKELGRLDGLLELIRVQYPEGALQSPQHEHGNHAAAPGHHQAAHVHMERPAGIVDASPRATVRVQAFDELRFEPRRLEVQAGVPTRIQLENLGAAEHSLVVKTPDGQRDWVHLHVPPGAKDAATYQLDEPGTYPVLCTIPGHTEGGMSGELVVVAEHGSLHGH